MPVFSAFGWAGEENALKFALSQLQLFIETLYARLPADAREDLPVFGLSAENQNVYLASADPYDKEAFIAFNARPMSLELQKDKTYRLHLTSVDYNHGFSLQPENINVQVLPGYEHVLKVTPNRAGTYAIVCNEFCGIGHHKMVSKLYVK